MGEHGKQRGDADSRDAESTDRPFGVVPMGEEGWERSPVGFDARGFDNAVEHPLWKASALRCGGCTGDEEVLEFGVLLVQEEGDLFAGWGDSLAEEAAPADDEQRGVDAARKGEWDRPSLEEEKAQSECDREAAEGHCRPQQAVRPLALRELAREAGESMLERVHHHDAASLRFRVAA